MLDKDKIIIVCYVDIRHIHDLDVPAFIQSVSDSIRFDESVERIIVPMRDSASRVECINPVLLSEEQYEETMKKVEKLKERFEEAIKTFKENKG